jgi:hypothetical protein
MAVAAVPFPDELPQGYEWFDDEPVFNPARHLALEKPTSIRYLSEFGYSDSEIQSVASPVAVSSPFQVLSSEGAAILLQVARRLKQHAVSCERIENMVRSGCYRSKFLRDLCVDESLTDLMCDIYQTDVAPHTMPVHLGHMNFSPTDLSKAVDKWHHDTLPLDAVMMVTDPATLDGGQFEYFVGTKYEMAELAKQGKGPPAERIEAPPFHGPGYAIALHGNMVVHRGAPLNRPGERISMVNGYVAMDTSADDQHRHKDLTLVDDHNVLYAEWAKHAAWRARSRLDRLLHEMQFTSDRLAVAAELNEAIADVRKAVEDMSDDSEHSMHHYEKSDADAR